MRGVDSMNQMCSCYGYKRRTNKWYRCIIDWLIEVAMNNSFIIYSQNQSNQAISALEFRKRIIAGWEDPYLARKRQIDNPKKPTPW